MPVPDSVPRAVCGTFYWRFQFFMGRRARKATVKKNLTTQLPLSFFRCAVLTLLFTVCTDHNIARDSIGTTHLASSVAYLHRSFLMLATALRFTRTFFPTSAEGSRYRLSLRCTGQVLSISCIAVCFITAGLLLACGDIEPNPGPYYGRSDRHTYESDTYLHSQSNQRDYYERQGNSNSNHQYQNDQDRGQSNAMQSIQSDITRTLKQAVGRIEASNAHQGQKIEQRIKSVEDKVERRLTNLEHKYDQLANGVGDLASQFQTLETENRQLRGELESLRQKEDYLDNSSRRNNLIFVGLDTVGTRDQCEFWEENEKKILDLIRYGMGVREEIDLERVYRSGKVTVAKFLSYKQKEFVLSQARSLKDSDTYCDVYVREDFSETVQEKRRRLLPTQRDLRQRGYKATLSYDKLMTNEAVFVFDVSSGSVIRQERFRRRPTGPAQRRGTNPQPSSHSNPPRTLQTPSQHPTPSPTPSLPQPSPPRHRTEPPGMQPTTEELPPQQSSRMGGGHRAPPPDRMEPVQPHADGGQRSPVQRADGDPPYDSQRDPARDSPQHVLSSHDFPALPHRPPQSPVASPSTSSADGFTPLWRDADHRDTLAGRGRGRGSPTTSSHPHDSGGRGGDLGGVPRARLDGGGDGNTATAEPPGVMTRSRLQTGSTSGTPRGPNHGTKTQRQGRIDIMLGGGNRAPAPGTQGDPDPGTHRRQGRSADKQRDNSSM